MVNNHTSSEVAKGAAGATTASAHAINHRDRSEVAFVGTSLMVSETWRICIAMIADFN